jgi:hypothetical protein
MENSVSPNYHKTCVSLVDTVSSADSHATQQQEKCAGSCGVKTLSPKDTA